MLDYSTIDITGLVPGLRGPLAIAAWIFVPDHPKGILFCLPDLSHTKAYYHQYVIGYPDDTYSFAEYMKQRGWLVIAVDHLGTGESSRPKQYNTLLDAKMLGSANEAALSCALKGFDGLDNLPIFVVAHGMGSITAILQQAHYRRYGAMALLGWSNAPYSFAAIEASLVRPWQRCEERDGDVIRVILRILFYAADVPQAVIHADEASGTDFLWPLLDEWDSPLIKALLPMLDIPIFLTAQALASHQESSYPSASVTTFPLPVNTGHCHNFAVTREQLWNRLDLWAQQILMITRTVV